MKSVRMSRHLKVRMKLARRKLRQLKPHQVKPFVMIFVSLIVILPFQNCNPVADIDTEDTANRGIASSDGSSDAGDGSGGDDGSSGGDVGEATPTPSPTPTPTPSPTPAPPPVCLYTSNNAPVIESITAKVGKRCDQSGGDRALSSDTLNVNVSQGMYSGSDPQVYLCVTMNVGAGENADQSFGGYDDVRTGRQSGSGPGNLDLGNARDQQSLGGGRYRFGIPINIDEEDGECLNGNYRVEINVSDAVANCPELAPATSAPEMIYVQLVNKCPSIVKYDANPVYNQSVAGTRVSADGNYAVASSPGDDSAAGNAGAAIVFERGSGNSWSELAVLTASNAQVNDAITGVDVEDLGGGNLMVVAGAPGTGRAFVFVRSSGSWSQVATLTPPGGGAGTLFGDDVSISGGQILVGAPSYQTTGAAFYYSSYSASAATIKPSGIPNFGEYGKSVSIEGSKVVVSSIGQEAVHVFSTSSLTSPSIVLTKPSGANGFGTAVAVEGSRIAVGAPNEKIGNRTDAGAVYVYNSANGSQTSRIARPEADAGSEDLFGDDVAFARGNANRLIVGASRKAAGVGAAYSYQLNLGTSNSNSVFKMRAPRGDRNGGQNSDRYGSAVAVTSNGYAIIGSPNEEESNGNSQPDVGAVFFTDIP